MSTVATAHIEREVEGPATAVSALGVQAALAAGVAERYFCYCCAQEVPAAKRSDLELQCLRCNATCVEHLELPSPTQSPTAAPSPPPPLLPATAPPRSLGPQRVRHQRRLLRVGGHGRRGGQAERHVGIICDGCNARDFAGIRYKCLGCPDFDFCASCHEQRSALHPGHDFETISTPRSAVPPFLADFLARAAARTSIAIIGIGFGGHPEVNSGLDDQQVAWWLANSRRLVAAEHMAAQEPPWCCPICAEGLEAECANGWVVQICGPTGGGARAGAADAEEDTPLRAGNGGDSAERFGGADASSKQPATPRVLGGSAYDTADRVVVADRAADHEEEAPGLQPQGHVYHEACLRRWLLKSNSCPVCRRSPVVPEA